MFRSASIAALALVAVPLAAQTPPKAITKTERLADADAEFKKVDTNGDGQMSRAEIQKFQNDAAARLVAARTKQMFTQLDSDRNGQLSAAEFDKLSNKSPQSDISGVMSIDSNKDGKISLAEHRAATLESFNQFDTNKDGQVTAAEYESVAKK
jgi:Ca2+-binding EF-hand superfamily protein